MNRTIALLNRQHAVRLDLRLFRSIVTAFLTRLRPDAEIELGVLLVDTPEITRLNETFVRHQGSTDVISFDYADPIVGSHAATTLRGEVFICVDEAISQARRFRTSWQSELIRYLVHGVLHLSGYDDQAPVARRVMKRAEDLWLGRLAAEFCFERLALRRARQPRRTRPRSRRGFGGNGRR